MTKERIEYLCQKIYEASTLKEADDPKMHSVQSAKITAFALELLTGFLIDINRIAETLEVMAAVPPALSPNTVTAVSPAIRP